MGAVMRTHLPRLVALSLSLAAPIAGAQSIAPTAPPAAAEEGVALAFAMRAGTTTLWTQSLRVAMGASGRFQWRGRGGASCDLTVVVRRTQDPERPTIELEYAERDAQGTSVSWRQSMVVRRGVTLDLDGAAPGGPSRVLQMAVR